MKIMPFELSLQSNSPSGDSRCDILIFSTVNVNRNFSTALRISNHCGLSRGS
jgi:hypothetical protein